MKLRIFVLCISALLHTCAARADVHEYNFDNGLKLLVKEDHRAPVVVSQVWYRIGGSYEHGGMTGISHALEHLMFRGTEKHGPGEFSRIISANGGNENAFTSSDFTAYFQTLEKSRLAVSFELEADRMRNLAITDKEYEHEIKVVREERRWRTEDQPQSFAQEVANATAFQTSPYRQPVVGWMADLEAMRAQDLRDWYRKWYAPNNAVVVVVGDVDADAVHALAQKYFAPLQPDNTPVPAARPEVEQQGIKRVTVRRPAEVPYLIMAWKAPVLTSATQAGEGVEPWEPYALEVLAGILDGGSSARLARNLVRGSEVAASVNTDYQLASRLDNLFSIEGTPAQDHDVSDLEKAIREQVEALKKDLVDDGELDRVKAQVVSSDIYQKDSDFYQGLLLGIFEMVGLGWRRVDEYVPSVQAVTAEQVRKVARKYLSDDRLTVAELDPLPIDPNAPPRRAAGDNAHVR